MDISEATKQKFYYEQSLLKEYVHWVVLLRLKQVTAGSMILIAKSEANNLGDLEEEAWAEFSEVCRDIETWTRQAFDAEKFNYLALMMKDPEVHFHFIRQTISSGHIVLKYCPTSDMIADIFTKSLAHNKFDKFRDLLQVGLK